MPRFAAFDIGTNTVLMAVAERDAHGALTAVLERGEITRLGEGVDRTRRLSPVAIERTSEAIARFAQEARAIGVSSFAAAATSAARDAENSAELVSRVRERCGIEVEVLPGEVEARLAFRAVQADFGALGGALIAIDIGGGSTELVFGGPPTGSPPSFRVSLDIGSVRLTERFVSSHPIPPDEEAAMRGRIREALERVPRAEAGALAVAVAATATSLLAVNAGLPSADDARVHGGELRRADLEKLVSRLARMSLEERRAVPGLNPKRADVICAGGFILLEALERLGLEACRVSDRGVRWGLLHERFGAETATR